MNKNFLKKALAAAILSTSLIMPFNVDAAKNKPIVIAEQGSFAVGGKTIKHAGTFSQDNFLSPEGQSVYTVNLTKNNPF